MRSFNKNPPNRKGKWTAAKQVNVYGGRVGRSDHLRREYSLKKGRKLRKPWKRVAVNAFGPRARQKALFARGRNRKGGERFDVLACKIIFRSENLHFKVPERSK